MRQVPQLMNSFTKRSKKSLMATCRLFRRQIQQHITVIRIKRARAVHPDPAVVQLLVQLDYSQLRILTLSGIFLDTDDLAELCQGTWLLLQTLALSDNSWSHMSQDLGLSPLWALDCPMLQNLDLASNNLGLHPWGVVTSCNWSQLRSLNLSFNGTDCDKLAKLVCADWPLLEELHLSWPLDADCVSMLVGAQWPQLQKLEVWHSKLDDTMMGLFATADWPLMECLELHGLYQMTNQGIRHLLEADWPLIRRLALWSFASEYGSFCLLAQKWPQLQLFGAEWGTS